MKVYFATSKLVSMDQFSYPVVFHILQVSSYSKKVIKSVDRAKDADLIVVSPFISWEKKFWVYIRLSKLLNIPLEDQFRFALEKLYGQNKKFIFWSFENLLHADWSKLGDLVYGSNIPRVTSASRRFDHIGVRMPYWYNYVDFPFIDASKFPYERYGLRYNIEKLLSPIESNYEKQDACLVARNINGIRGQVYNTLSSRINIDLYSKNHKKIPNKTTKYQLLNKYKYYLATENSLGVGYETEKVPEAWVAGCIPLGCLSVPDGDFNPKIYSSNLLNNDCDFPLLSSPPCVNDIIEYIGKSL